MAIVKADERRVKTGVRFMLGNYALVEGAISAGCDFFGGYPITPANEISELMAKRLPEVRGRFLQGEDELCSIFACAGASLAGAKAMTATASAGFNYMQEGLGYCYTVEAPVVIADVQRCRGENYASQADVMQMRFGASGDYEAIVVCPSSCLLYTSDAADELLCVDLGGRRIIKKKTIWSTYRPIPQTSTRSSKLGRK